MLTNTIENGKVFKFFSHYFLKKILYKYLKYMYMLVIFLFCFDQFSLFYALSKRLKTLQNVRNKVHRMIVNPLIYEYVLVYL